MTTTRIQTGSSGRTSPMAIIGPTHQTIADKAITPTNASSIGWKRKCHSFFIRCSLRVRVRVGRGRFRQRPEA
jgi:hypothetical protein